MADVITLTDQTGHTISLHVPARKILSLVPSQTELMHTIGLDEEVIGITKFCVHPEEWFRKKARIGGTKDLKIDLIISMKPDLVIANQEENVKEQVELLRTIVPVYTSRISTLEETLRMILDIGLLTDRTGECKNVVKDIKDEFQTLSVFSQISTLYLIWKNPYMSVGGDTFIHHLMSHAGFRNVMGSEKRYPVINEQEIQRLQPELIFLSSEPYPFKDIHIAEIQALAPKAKVCLVNGEMFSWYGSRLTMAPSYFRTLRESLHLPHD